MDFKYYNPVKIDFGVNALKRLSSWLNGRKAILITSHGFVKRGIVEHITLENPEIMSSITDVQPNPTVNQLEMYYKTLDFNSFDVIVALGGGSVIDIAKALSIYSEDGNKETFEVVKSMLLNGYKNEEISYKPIIAIPTTAGTGSEVTPWGTIWDDINKKKYSIHTNELWCEVAICDPKLTLTLPKDLTIQTGLDALSHSLESIWNINASPLSLSYAKEAIQKIIETLPELVKNLDDIHLRSDMMLASLQAGLAFSNTQTAIAHAMSYYMTLHKGIPHGIAASITLPDIVDVALSEEVLSRNLRNSLGEQPVEKLHSLFKQLNITIDYRHYDFTKDDFTAIKQSLSQTSRSGNSLIDSSKLFRKLVSSIE